MGQSTSLPAHALQSNCGGYGPEQFRRDVCVPSRCHDAIFQHTQVLITKLAELLQTVDNDHRRMGTIVAWRRINHLVTQRQHIADDPRLSIQTAPPNRGLTSTASGNVSHATFSARSTGCGGGTTYTSCIDRRGP